MISAILFSICAYAAQAQAPTQASKLLWDSWYTVTVGGTAKPTRYAYYNDRVETQPGNRIFFQNRFWKREEGFVNEEALGGLAMNDAELTPLFFNFQSTYRSNEVKIDGSVKDKELTVRIKRNNQDLPLVRRSIPKKTILSVFFPLLLKREFSAMKEKKTVGFSTILEDSVEQAYAPASGYYRMEAPDAYAKKTGSRKLAIKYRELNSTWYIDSNGMPLRIELPEQKTLVEKVSSKEAAEKFFKDGG